MSRKALFCADIKSIGNRAYILSRDSQGLFCYDHMQEDVLCYGSVLDSASDMMLTSVLYQDRIYFAPYIGKTMSVFHIDKEEFSKIPFDLSVDGIKAGLCQVGFAYDGSIFWICGNSRLSLISYDVQTKKYTDRTIWKDEAQKLYGRFPNLYIYDNPCIVEKELWIPIDEEDTILQYNIENETYQFRKIGDNGILYNTINYDGINFWITGNKPVIIKWNANTDKIEEYKDFPKSFTTKETGWPGIFFNGIFVDGNIYYSPLSSNLCIKFDTATGNMKKIMEIDINSICYRFAMFNDGIIYMELNDVALNQRKESYLINILDSDSITQFPLGINGIHYGKNAERYLYIDSITSFDSLELLLKRINTDKDSNSKEITTKGDKIWRQIQV